MNEQRCDTASPWVGGLDGSAVEALAIDLARQAGELLAGRFGTAVAVEYKDESRRDPVTEVDRECQRVISSAIKEAFPSHGFLGEEGGSEDDQVVPDVVWVVDPLDGTKNYTCGLPVYACSIGVLYRGEPVVGAVYLPWPGDGKGLVLHGSAGFRGLRGRTAGLSGGRAQARRDAPCGGPRIVPESVQARWRAGPRPWGVQGGRQHRVRSRADRNGATPACGRHVSKDLGRCRGRDPRAGGWRGNPQRDALRETGGPAAGRCELAAIRVVRPRRGTHNLRAYA